LISLGIVFFSPEIGIMHGAGHYGSWRGLFWHRNHTGIMMAFFNMLFLLRFFEKPSSGDKKINTRNKLTFGIFYLLTAIHVFGAMSATGKIIFAFSNLFSFTGLFWMKWRSKIKPWQYYAIGIFLAGIVYVLAINLAVVFKMLNRDPSMTGRTSMWPDLFYHTYLLKPWLGHGFATIWAQENFRILIEQRWGWSYQPYFSDNGYLDILLNLGLVGLLIFLYGAAVVVQRVIVKLYKHNLPGFLFLLAILFQVFMANISYSFLFEVDYFMWSMLVLVAFLMTGESVRAVDSPQVLLIHS
jgi:exopolysaccharide production protein ExoQ